MKAQAVMLDLAITLLPKSFLYLLLNYKYLKSQCSQGKCLNHADLLQSLFLKEVCSMYKGVHAGGRNMMENLNKYQELLFN